MEVMHTHAITFIQDLAIIMLIAGFTTVLCHRLKQPIVLGYILAGIIVGGHTPPFALISDEATIKTLAELGVMFLMFSLGLEFDLHKLSRVGVVAFIAAVLEITLMIALGYWIGRLFGWTQIDSIFLGAILSISSTTIIVKALGELGLKKEVFAQLIFGILILEDVFAILILALLSTIASTGSLHVSEIIVTTAKLSSFLVVSLILGVLIVPRLLAYIASFKSNEMLLISALGLCFGFSMLVVKLDYSIALGAFIIGSIIAESRQLIKIEHLIAPIRDMFSAIFFVSVGLLFDLGILDEYLVPIIVITVAVILGKVISCSLGVLLGGRDGKTAMKVGMGLAQIGEFSFIIASLGITLGVTGEFLYSIAVSVSIITTLLTPYMIKYSDLLTQYIAILIPKNISNTFESYSVWVQSINTEEDQSRLRKAIQYSVVQVVINLLVVTGIFLSGGYIAQSNIGDFLVYITNIYIQKTIIWAIALILSLPFLIAVYRRIKALGMMLAELNTGFNSWKLISAILPGLSIPCMMIFISLLSAGILPPIELLFIVLFFSIILIVLLFPWFIKLHSRLQMQLLESMKKEERKRRD